MEKTDSITHIISKWNKKAADGRMLKQVVIITPVGKVNGKQKYTSRTRHIPA